MTILGPSYVARFPSLDGDPRVGANPTMSIQARVDDDGRGTIDCLALADRWSVAPNEASDLAHAILSAVRDLEGGPP
jgi:hypothetical protein